MQIKTHTLTTPRGQLTFAIQSGKTRRRVLRLLDKEPETIRWLDSLAPSSVFWDIGANTGGFSLYAALVPEIQVVAFEPGAVNHYLLTLSAELNGLDQRIAAYCIGFDAHTHVLDLSASQLQPAASFRVSGHHDSDRFDSHQAMLCFSIDDFLSIFRLPPPTHLKIDVPNLPNAILRGASRTLNDGSTRDILVELDSETFQPGEMARLLECNSSGYGRFGSSEGTSCRRR